MTHTAIVIPDDETQPIGEITWDADDDLLDLFYATIGCRYVETGPAIGDAEGTRLYFWLDEEGKLERRPINPRATALAHALGWSADLLVGPVVLTGGADPEGNTLGLTNTQYQALTTLLTMTEV